MNKKTEEGMRKDKCGKVKEERKKNDVITNVHRMCIGILENISLKRMKKTLSIGIVILNQRKLMN